MTNRTWTKYDYKVGNQIKHSGITEDKERREGEHQRCWPGGRLVQEGQAPLSRTDLRDSHGKD